MATPPPWGIATPPWWGIATAPWWGIATPPWWGIATEPGGGNIGWNGAPPTKMFSTTPGGTAIAAGAGTGTSMSSPFGPSLCTPTVAPVASSTVTRYRIVAMSLSSDHVQRDPGHPDIGAVRR